MAISLPLPVRVAAGLVATGWDTVRSLPGGLPALSVNVAGHAVRLSMRLQQEITQLAARGDELLAGITSRPSEHPTWARFDEEDGTQAEAPDGPAGSDDVDQVAQSPGHDRFDDTEFDTVGGTSPDLPLTEDAGGRGAVPDWPESPADLTVPDTDPAEHTDPTEGAAPAEAVGVEREAGTVEEADPAVDADTDWSADTDPLAPGRSDVETVSRANGLVGAAGAPHLTVVRGDPYEPGDSAGPSDSDGPTAAPDAGPSALPGYDRMTLAQVRGRLRGLSPDDVAGLLAYERAGAGRAPFLTLLTNRISTLEHEAQ